MSKMSKRKKDRWDAAAAAMRRADQAMKARRYRDAEKSYQEAIRFLQDEQFLLKKGIAYLRSEILRAQRARRLGR